MQAIVTKFLGATNYRGSRVKAECDRGAIVVPWEHSLDVNENHDRAAALLCDRFAIEDATTGDERYRTPYEASTWKRPLLGGDMPARIGGRCYIFAS